MHPAANIVHPLLPAAAANKVITLQPSVPLSAVSRANHSTAEILLFRSGILKRFVKFLQGSVQRLPGGLSEDGQNPCKIIHYITHLISSGHKLYVLQQSGDIKLRQSSAQ